MNEVKEKMKGRKVSLNEYAGPMKQCDIPKFMRRNWNVCVRLNKLDINSLQFPALPVMEPPSKTINENNNINALEGGEEPQPS